MDVRLCVIPVENCEDSDDDDDDGCDRTAAIVMGGANAVGIYFGETIGLSAICMKKVKMVIKQICM